MEQRNGRAGELWSFHISTFYASIAFKAFTLISCQFVCASVPRTAEVTCLIRGDGWWMCWLVNDAKTITKTESSIFIRGVISFLYSIFFSLLKSPCDRDSVRYSKRNDVNCSAYSPPTQRFYLLVRWSIWWDMVRIDGRVVTWTLHRSIHFVLPIRAAVVFVWPIPLSSVRLTFLAVIIQTNKNKRMRNQCTNVSTKIDYFIKFKQ